MPNMKIKSVALNNKRGMTVSKTIEIEFDKGEKVYFNFQGCIRIYSGTIRQIDVDVALNEVTYTIHRVNDCTACMTSFYVYASFDAARNSALEELKSEYEENVKILNEQEEPK